MTIIKKDLMQEVCMKHKLNVKQSAHITEAFFSVLKKELIRGKSITIIHLGKFTVRDKTPRMGRNPKTGEPMLIPAKRVATFKASVGLTKHMKDSYGKGISYGQ